MTQVYNNTNFILVSRTEFPKVDGNTGTGTVSLRYVNMMLFHNGQDKCSLVTIKIKHKGMKK